MAERRSKKKEESNMASSKGLWKQHIPPPPGIDIVEPFEFVMDSTSPMIEKAAVIHR